MKYDQNIADAIENDPRWKGIVRHEMIKVWRKRNTIPNQYFNPKYVKLIKEGEIDLARQVKDPYYNEAYIVRDKLTDHQKKEQDTLLNVLKNPKLRANEVYRQIGISQNLVNGAMRPYENSRFVHLRAEHILALKKNIQELRIRLKQLVETLQDKPHYSETQVEELDSLLSDKRLMTLPIIDNKLYYSRVYARHNNRQTLYETEEIHFLLERIAIFLLETAL